MIGRSRLLCYISLLSGLWHVMIDTEIEIYLVGQLTRLGGTSLCGSESSWCCLRPKRCNRQNQIPHRRPASPQTGGRGCGIPFFEAGQGWNRCRREGEGTARRLKGSCCHHHSRRPPLALMQVFITNIIIITNDQHGLIQQTFRCSNGDPKLK